MWHSRRRRRRPGLITRLTRPPKLPPHLRTTRREQPASQPGKNALWILVISLALIFGCCVLCVVAFNAATSNASQSNSTANPTTIDTSISTDTPIPTDTPVPTDTPIPTQPPTLNTQPTQPPVQPTPTAAPSCYPLTNGGKCYEPGEYCRDDDHGVTGVAGDGKQIICTDNDGWRWEPIN